MRGGISDNSEMDDSDTIHKRGRTRRSTRRKKKDKENSNSRHRSTSNRIRITKDIHARSQSRSLTKVNRRKKKGKENSNSRHSSRQSKSNRKTTRGEMPPGRNLRGFTMSESGTDNSKSDSRAKDSHDRFDDEEQKQEIESRMTRRHRKRADSESEESTGSTSSENETKPLRNNKKYKMSFVDTCLLNGMLCMFCMRLCFLYVLHVEWSKSGAWHPKCATFPCSKMGTNIVRKMVSLIKAIFVKGNVSLWEHLGGMNKLTKAKIDSQIRSQELIVKDSAVTYIVPPSKVEFYVIPPIFFLWVTTYEYVLQCYTSLIQQFLCVCVIGIDNYIRKLIA